VGSAPIWTSAGLWPCSSSPDALLPILVLRPCPPPHPRPSSSPSSSSFSPSSSSLSTSSFGRCGAQLAVVEFVRSPGVLLSGGRVVRYCVVVVVALWGCVVAAVVLSRWWLGFRCGSKVVVVVGL